MLSMVDHLSCHTTVYADIFACDKTGFIRTQKLYHFGDIFGDLEMKHCRISDRDTMIAAHARSLGATMVTNNIREFSRVEGLKYEDWSR